jgi:hypothetical protein
MPKKTTTTRGGAQRNKPKVQKNIELVHEDSTAQELESSSNVEPAATSVTAVAAPPETRKSAAKRSEQSENKETTPVAATPAKGSASARLASRRQAAHKVQQRAAATLITAEHYAYVRRDLRFIAILATIMFAILLGLRFVPGIGY